MQNSLSLYFTPKLIAIGLLGVASGLPLALTLSTLTVWLSEEGVSRTAIGLFAAITTPYAIKFLWSPLIDHVSIPYVTAYLGRRRGWMLVIQLLLIISIVALGATNPRDAAWLTALAALIVAFLSASQDIVIDAYRIELLAPKEQAAGAAMGVFGYRIGMLISGAGALFLATYTDWFITYLVMGSCVSIGMITVWWMGEPVQTPSLPSERKTIMAWFVRAVIAPFSEFANKTHWWVLLAIILLYKLGDAFAGVMTNPFLLEMGFSKAEIASIVKTFGLFATLAGAFIGGSMAHRWGLYRSLVICGVLQMLSNLAFVYQAHIGYDLSVLSFTIALENISGGMGTAAFVAFISRLCHMHYTATQYALLSSLAAVGRTWLSAGSGWVVDQFDWSLFFIISTLLAVPGVLLMIIMKKNMLLWLHQR